MIRKEDYYNAYVEVLEILKYIPAKDLSKIPKEIICRFEERKSKQYKFIFDKKKSIQQQLSNTSRAILSNLYRDYWATEYERKVITAKEKINRQRMEEIKIKRFSNKELFNTKKC